MLRVHLLFIHVASAMGLFAGLGIEGVALARLRRTTGGDLWRSAFADLGTARRVGEGAMPLLLVSGLWLATAYWHWQGAWMGLGFLGLILIGAGGALTTGRAVRRLRRMLDQPGFDALLREAGPALQRSFLIRTLLLAVVVYLMTVKPA